MHVYENFFIFLYFSIDAMKLYTLYYKYFKHDNCIGYAGFIMECGYLVVVFPQAPFRATNVPGQASAEIL